MPSVRINRPPGYEANAEQFAEDHPILNFLISAVTGIDPENPEVSGVELMMGGPMAAGTKLVTKGGANLAVKLGQALEKLLSPGGAERAASGWVGRLRNTYGPGLGFTRYDREVVERALSGSRPTGQAAQVAKGVPVRLRQAERKLGLLPRGGVETVPEEVMRSAGTAWGYTDQGLINAFEPQALERFGSIEQVMPFISINEKVATDALEKATPEAKAFLANVLGHEGIHTAMSEAPPALQRRVMNDLNDLSRYLQGATNLRTVQPSVAARNLKGVKEAVEEGGAIPAGSIRHLASELLAESFSGGGEELLEGVVRPGTRDELVDLFGPLAARLRKTLGISGRGKNAEMGQTVRAEDEWEALAEFFQSLLGQ